MVVGPRSDGSSIVRATVGSSTVKWRRHPSTLTGVLRRLETRGMLLRRSDPRDARRALFGLTPRGRKMDTLRTSQFPKAELVPTKISGTVPASGDFTLTLSGKMTIHGTTKEVTFDVLGKRDGANLTATATANPTWRFADFGMTAPSVPFRVVSLVDEIKVVVDLVATAKG